MTYVVTEAMRLAYQHFIGTHDTRSIREWSAELSEGNFKDSIVI